VGPSSAMAIVPRHIVYPYFKAEIVWNATKQNMFPNRITKEGVYSFCDAIYSAYLSGCPSQDWETVGIALRGFADEISTSDTATQHLSFKSEDYSATRHLSFKLSRNDKSTAPQGMVATVEQAIVANKIVDFTSKWSQILVTGEMIQPFVRVDCEPLYARRNDTHRDSPILFGSSPSIDQRVSLFTEGEAVASAQSIDGAHVIWIDSPGSSTSNVSIFTLIINPNSTDVRDILEGVEVSACAVKAAWGLTTFQATSYPIRPTANMSKPSFDGG
jgi:hypothetical protein